MLVPESFDFRLTGLRHLNLGLYAFTTSAVEVVPEAAHALKHPHPGLLAASGRIQRFRARRPCGERDVGRRKNTLSGGALRNIGSAGSGHGVRLRDRADNRFIPVATGYLLRPLG